MIYVAGWQVFGTSREEAWDRSRDALVQIASAAKARDVTIVVEPTTADSNLVESCDDALRMMREAEADNVKVMFDTYHALYRNEVSTDYVQRMSGDLAHVHFADANRAAPSDAGRADYRGIIQALADVRFDGFITMEIGFDRRAVEPDRIARDAFTYLKPLVDAAKARQ